MSIERLMRAVEDEFGACPSWQPLIESAWAELLKTKMNDLIKWHHQHVPDMPLEQWLRDCESVMRPKRRNQQRSTTP